LPTDGKYGNSITGGYVYRGRQGIVILRRVSLWRLHFEAHLRADARKWNPQSRRQVGSVPQRLVSFGTDEAGHIYAVGYEGMVYQLGFQASTLRRNQTRLASVALIVAS